MLSIRFPAALELKMRSVIEAVVADHQAMKLPGFAYGPEEGELEVVFLAVDHALTPPVPVLSMDAEGDVMPQPAHGVAEIEEDGA